MNQLATALSAAGFATTDELKRKRNSAIARSVRGNRDASGRFRSATEVAADLAIVADAGRTLRK